MRYLNYFILIALVFYSGFLLQKSNPIKRVNPAADYHADAFLEDVTALSMSKVGLPQNKLISPRVIHYPIHDTTIFSKPHIIIYTKNEEEPWHTTANQGKSTEGKKIIELTDNVEIKQPAGPHNKEAIMTTKHLLFYPEEKFAHTEQAVKFTEPGIIVNAIGMNAYIQEKRVQLLTQTRGQHEKVG